MHGAFCYWRTHVLQVLGSRLLCHKLRRQEMFVAFGFWCMHLLVKRAQNTEDFVRQGARCRPRAFLMAFLLLCRPRAFLMAFLLLPSWTLWRPLVLWLALLVAFLLL